MGYGKYKIDLTISNLDEIIKKYAETTQKIDDVFANAINETLAFGKDMILQESNKIRLNDEREAYQESYIVKAKKTGNQIVGFIKTDNQKATYAENGTGIVGSRHPNTAISGWEYDVNKHGEAGWVYKGSDGKFHHTKGMPAQKIYYRTSIQMKKKLKELVEKGLKQL